MLGSIIISFRGVACYDDEFDFIWITDACLAVTNQFCEAITISNKLSFTKIFEWMVSLTEEWSGGAATDWIAGMNNGNGMATFTCWTSVTYGADPIEYVCNIAYLRNTTY